MFQCHLISQHRISECELFAFLVTRLYLFETSSQCSLCFCKKKRKLLFCSFGDAFVSFRLHMISAAQKCKGCNVWLLVFLLCFCFLLTGCSLFLWHQCFSCLQLHRHKLSFLCVSARFHCFHATIASCLNLQARNSLEITRQQQQHYICVFMANYCYKHFNNFCKLSSKTQRYTGTKWC